MILRIGSSNRCGCGIAIMRVRQELFDATKHQAHSEKNRGEPPGQHNEFASSFGHVSLEGYKEAVPTAS